MAFVYWIHLPEHTDITSEGYIGFTSKTVENRWREHTYSQTAGRCGHLYNAMSKYEDSLIVETLVEGSNEYCLEIENKLRPTPCIGWNLGIGGISPRLGVKQSDEVKAKISTTMKGRKPSDNTRAKLSASKTGKFHSEACKEKMSENRRLWRHPQVSAIWLNCIPLYSEWCTRNKINRPDIAIKVKCSVATVNVMIQRFQSGWNPNEDQEYLSWLKERKSNES